MSGGRIRVLVWDENSPHVPKAVYPEGIRGAVAAGLRELSGSRVVVGTTYVDEPEQGVSAGAVARIVARVHHDGLGFIALHSAHYSKPFQRILGCTGHVKGGWREDDQPEEICVRARRGIRSPAACRSSCCRARRCTERRSMFRRRPSSCCSRASPRAASTFRPAWRGPSATTSIATSSASPAGRRAG